MSRGVAQAVRRSLSSLSRTSILCIAVVGLLLFVVVLSRVHPTSAAGGASTTPAVGANIASSFSLKRRAHGRTGNSGAEQHRQRHVRFRYGTRATVDHNAAIDSHTSSVIREYGAKHHTVAGSQHHKSDAALSFHALHGGKHPQMEATQRHDPGDHADHEMLHPQLPEAAAEKKDIAPLLPPLAPPPPGFIRHTMRPFGAQGQNPPPDPSPLPVASASPSAAASPLQQHHEDHGSDLLPSYLENTAIYTMATGDEAARMAVALVASLRDVKTRVPSIVVMAPRGGIGSSDCTNEEWKKREGREGIVCSGPNTIAEEIVGEENLKALQRLGATVKVVDPIPRTPWTSLIPGDPGKGGGGRTFWSAAFEKLLIFNATEHRKIMWMDSDTLVLQNVDHLMKEPTFTAAFTYNCCNGVASAEISGGLWVLEPSKQLGEALWKMMMGPVPGTDNDAWHWGDMQIVRHFFGKPRKPDTIEPLWPSIDDQRYGVVPGFDMLPEARNMTRKEIEEHILAQVEDPIKRKHAGLIPGAWDGKSPLWRILDPRYDQCIGNCECLPGRDAPLMMKTVHFSCLQNGLRKPGGYASEHELFEAVSTSGLSCTRFWFALWLEKYSKGVHYGTDKAKGAEDGRLLLEGRGRTGLPGPHWTGAPLAVFDHAQDDKVLAVRLERHKKEEAEAEARRAKEKEAEDKKKAEKAKAFVKGEKVGQ